MTGGKRTTTSVVYCTLVSVYAITTNQNNELTTKVKQSIRRLLDYLLKIIF